MVMLAEYGTMSLKDVLTPAMQLAEGYPIEAQTANSFERSKETLKQWPYSKAVFLPHPVKTRSTRSRRNFCAERFTRYPSEVG